ncbi:putative kinesin [Leishmania major strain Friedlin]|uniref:Putative kinesin n=1 Tax=Leishmania major TaxID=5664 RepID=Q4QDF3_LEIMA|nr:putative kinesin [Leishmania major strain Friedlin]CAG9572755.1 kinesin_-_putative [Leishmania major strain Friedlin]CAJ07153.1 putative kinesin [Leishmania major strain Friedlin]|eukprot:XP_001682645.1 putative kinesin [Leishmania major strain Friedlin]
MSEYPMPITQTQSNAMKVYIRVRPFSEREIAQKVAPHSTVRIDAQNPTQLTILDPSRGFRPLTTHPFTRCFWSVFEKGNGDLLNKVDTYLTGGMNSARRSRAQSLVTGQPVMNSVRRGTRTGLDSDATSSTGAAYDGAGSAPVMVDANVSHPPYAGQDQVYMHVGKPIVGNTLDGYNGCVFAYGQTGSGKTFTMLGYAPSTSDIRARKGSVPCGVSSMENSTPLDSAVEPFESDDGDDVVDKTGLDPNELQGIIPRACTDLFDGLRAKRAKDSDFTYRVEVSYYEIYNEKVFDLIRPQRNTDLRIRNSPNSGPFIEGLTWKMVSKEEDVGRVIRKGMQERHTAATKFNDRSSRSHAILTFNIVQLSMDDSDNAFQMRSKLNLVDLAGSERTGAAGAEGNEFHDGVKINQSLTVLGRVIDRLADLSQNKGGGFSIPYRESNLTWVLSDSIGGNSQTSMVATVSPHSINYEEMRQTIMYACRAQQVLNKARRNVDPTIMELRELRAQVVDLRLRLKEAGGSNYTNEYVRGLEKRVKELEWQCADQERIVSQLRAELESAGIADPTLILKPSARGGAGAAGAGGGSANGGDVQGGVSAATYRRTNEQLQSELTSANKEIVLLQTKLLESAKAKSGKLDGDTESTIAKLQAKCDLYRNSFREWEAHLNQYNTYQWRWSTDYIFGTFEDKMNLLMRQCQNLMMDKDACVMDALNRGESAQLRETAKIQREHLAEVSALTAQYRESIEKLKKEYAERDEERLKRQKEVSNSSELRMQATRETFEQEKRRWVQERDNMKLGYEEKLAALRAEYQGDLKRLRELLASTTGDRQRQGGALQELQERHESEMKSIGQDMERERKRREAELEMVKKQMSTELARKEEQIAARDAQARRTEEEATKLRRDNLKLQTDMRTKERQLNTEIKDLLLKQENMIAVLTTIVGNYEKNPTSLTKDIEALRAFVSDKDYAAFRAKAKEGAFRDPASRRASAVMRSPSSVDEQRSREVEDIRNAIESMRKTRSDQQANLQQVQQHVYAQLSRSRGFQSSGEVDERSHDGNAPAQNGNTAA